MPNLEGYTAYSLAHLSASIDVTNFSSLTVTSEIDSGNNNRYGKIEIRGNKSGVLLAANRNGETSKYSSTNTFNVANDAMVTLYWEASGSETAHQYGRFSNIKLKK